MPPPPSRPRSWDLGNSTALVKSRGKQKWRRVITRSIRVSTLGTQRLPVFPFSGDVSRRCCSEGTISATVALVVDGVFVDLILGIALRVRR